MSNLDSSLSLVKRKRIEKLFLRLQYKLCSSLRNKGNSLLSTDILRDTVKRDLLRLVLLNVETKFLNLIKCDFNSFDDKSILLELVKFSTEDFLMNCYGSKVIMKSKVISRSLYFQFLLENSNILLKVPFLELFSSNTKIFHSTFDPIYVVASDKFLEVLFDNLIVEISNCVMQIIITEFSLIYNIRQVLYKSKFLSLRNIERFKNNLAWQNRLNLYVNYPKNLYNSQYGIWIIRLKGIYYRVIYANRSAKLVELRKTALLTITLVEFQDFAITRIEEILYLIGDRFRYTLTVTIGQFIGLIWRGIIDSLKK